MSTLVPLWRQHAPPGISLAAAMARAPILAAPASLPRLDPSLSSILRPEVAPHWRSARVSTFTPQYVEQTLLQGLAGDLLSQWELFDLMEETWPMLAKCLAELRRQVAAMKWTLRPWAEEGQSPEPEAEQRAALVSYAIWRMRPRPDLDELDFGGLLFDLLDAWGKGISLIELLWEEREHPDYGLIIVPRAGQWVHPSNYGVAEDGRIGLKNAARGAAPTRLAELPPYKFIVGIARQKTSHYLGAALLRPLAWWWAAANFSASWLLNHAQIFGIPFRFATYPTGASDALIRRIGEALTNAGSAGWLAVPEGTTLQLFESKTSAGNSPQDGILDRADRACVLLILGQSLTSDTQGVGSQALGRVHERVREDILRAAADWAAGVLNRQLIPWICELNYGSDDLCPEIHAEPAREPDRAADAQRVATLLSAGIPLPREWLYDHLDIPLPGPEDDVIAKPAPTPFPGLAAARALTAAQTPPGAAEPTVRYPHTSAPKSAPTTELRDIAEGASGAPRQAPPHPAAAPLAAAGAAPDSAPTPPPPEMHISPERRAALAAAYSGAMRPFLEAILASDSPADALRRVRELYADWSPERLQAELDAALQIAAAAGAAAAKPS
jgi:phage gp29-like protein